MISAVLLAVVGDFAGGLACDVTEKERDSRAGSGRDAEGAIHTDGDDG